MIAFTATPNGDIFAGTYVGGGVFRSSDNGDTWIEKNNGLVATDVRAIATKFDGTVFAGTYGIGAFRSSDNGQSWERINNGLFAHFVRSLAIGHIFAGTDFVDGLGGVFRLTDNGDSWTHVSQGVIEFDVRALAVNSNGHIFAGTYVGGTIGGVWHPQTMARAGRT